MPKPTQQSECLKSNQSKAAAFGNCLGCKLKSITKCCVEPMDSDGEHHGEQNRQRNPQDENRWVQPEDPILKINACTELVFPSHGWLSQVGYVTNDDRKVFWDLQFFCEHYIKMMPERSRKTIYPRDIIKLVKAYAIKARLQDHLHLRGNVERHSLRNKYDYLWLVCFAVPLG